MSVACVAAQGLGSLPIPAAMRDHPGHCLACQASAARNRRIERTMAAMRTMTRTAPPGLLEAAVRIALDGTGEPAPRVRRRLPELAAAGATIAGAVAGGIAVVVWRRAHV